MRFSFASALVVALAAEGTVASTWFGKTAYNKWHETELERWLSDNNVPYPTASDRKDLETLVKSNWNDKVVSPYTGWDTKQLNSYLTTKGYQAKKGTVENKDGLIASVKSYWSDTEDSVNTAYSSVSSWIFDSWTDSQLKSYADKHSIPVPQPRKRDSLLKSVRENYQTVANKLSETAAYPGNWLYESWTESELKAFLDERGIPAPQPSTRDSLVASVRRNSYLASKNLSASASSASASAASAKASLSDAVFDAWSDSQLKEWADKNNIKVPQGSKRNELIALARKNRAAFLGDSVASSASSVASSASSYVGAATSSAGNYGTQATKNAVSFVDKIKAQLGLLGADASASYTSATNSASSAASSLSLAASSSASSLSLAASSSASSASVTGSKSASSASSVGSKSASSASSVASKSAKSAASSNSKGAVKASDAATESATKGKNRVGEAAQKATDYVKEEL